MGLRGGGLAEIEAEGNGIGGCGGIGGEGFNFETEVGGGIILVEREVDVFHFLVGLVIVWNRKDNWGLSVLRE